MKIEAKSFNRSKCTSEMIGSLTFKAENEVDAVQLCALFDQWHQHKGRVKQLREEALMRYCKKHNVTITVTPNEDD